MRLFQWAKDGGPESNVDGFFIIEIKWLFSIVLLRFEGKSRANFHSHAFHAWTWLLSGNMTEIFYRHFWPRMYRRSLLPKLTRRKDIHKVNAHGVAWCISLRGPWQKTWWEVDPDTDEVIVLGNGRTELGRWEFSE